MLSSRVLAVVLVLALVVAALVSILSDLRCDLAPSDGEFDNRPKSLQKNVGRRKRRLEFVHLTKTGGTAIEKAAVSVGVRWGYCHFDRGSACNSPFTTNDVQRNETLQGPRSGLGSVVQSPWHTPPWVFASHARFFTKNIYEDADLFTVVRNPYTRVMSEYYCPWAGLREDDPDKMNKWVQEKLTLTPERLRGQLESFRVNGTTGNEFFIGTKHMIPQFEYVFSPNGDRWIPEENVLRFENITEEFRELMERYGLGEWIKLPEEKTNTWKTENRLSHRDLNPDTVRMINNFFGRDFEEFGYEQVDAFYDHGMESPGKGAEKPGVLANEQHQVHSPVSVSKGGTSEPTIKLVICAIVKDEAPYLAEWIEHHKSIGFDNLLLYNDNSIDDSQCVLDAYAQQGNVLRIPQDIGGKYMENLPWNQVYIKGNIQEPIFEACRRYLIDRELSSNNVGSTWMLTSDIDEFLWFDRKFGSARKTLTTILSESPKMKTISIPNCIFGTSGKESFEMKPLMRRFTHRDGNAQCLPNKNDGGTIFLQGKAISQVAALVQGKRIDPHIHTVANSTGSINEVREYMKLAHYKTKSREEFYYRVCVSRYFNKYFDPSHEFNRKADYPGCCSPSGFFDYVGDQFIHEDLMMLPFAEDLESNMSNASHLCNSNPEKALCPKSVMEMKGKEGLKNIKQFFESSSSPKAKEAFDRFQTPKPK